MIAGVFVLALGAGGLYWLVPAVIFSFIKAILDAWVLLGEGNLGAVSLVQAMLFVLATLEIYVLCILVLWRTWIAFLVGLLVGLNIPLLSFMKPIMSEPLALWLLVSLALVCVFTKKKEF